MKKLLKVLTLNYPFLAEKNRHIHNLNSLISVIKIKIRITYTPYMYGGKMHVCTWVSVSRL